MANGLPNWALGLAAEYAVASELCRRGIYAQLTFGNQKRTDILVFSSSGRVARIEVKSKQGPVWPNCKGIADKRAFLVFVDYQGCEPAMPPEFYVLSERDWRRVLEKNVAELKARHPKKRVEITSENTAVFVDQIGANGKPYVGMSIRPADLKRYRARWGTIAKRMGVG
jgi:hypothetical protein